MLISIKLITLLCILLNITDLSSKLLKKKGSPEADTEQIRLRVNFVKKGKQQRICLGENDFRAFRLRHCYYVDKTLLVEEIFDYPDKIHVITRPKYWGKSFNMNMLLRFFEIEVDEFGNPRRRDKCQNYILFQGGRYELPNSNRCKILKPLSVSSRIDLMIPYQGYFGVVFLNFSNIDGNSSNEFLQGITSEIKKAYRSYEYLAKYYKGDFRADSRKNRQLEFLRLMNEEFSAEDFEKSVFFLIEMVRKHFDRKIILLIDDYDIPIRRSYIRFGEKVNECIIFQEKFKKMLGKTLSSRHIKRAILTGVFSVPTSYSILDKYEKAIHSVLEANFSTHYGFNQKEMIAMYENYKHIHNLRKYNKWYSGFNMADKIKYIPGPIMESIKSGEKIFKDYIDQENIDFINDLFLDVENQLHLEALKEGEIIQSTIPLQIDFSDGEMTKPRSFIYLLLSTGFLTPLNGNPEWELWNFKIPNKLMKRIFLKKIKTNLGKPAKYPFDFY